jgi:TonB family protein
MSPRRTSAVLLLIPVLAARVSAQHVLMAENDGKMALVRAVSGSLPCVETGGSVKPIIGSRGFVLKDVPEYLPAFVAMRDVTVFDHTVSVAGTSIQGVGNEIGFDAKLESGCPLEDVFLAIELTPSLAERSIFIVEVGKLEANKEKRVAVTVESPVKLGRGKFRAYLFSGGLEVLQSGIAPDVREAAFDRIVAKRIKDVVEAPPKLFFGPVPKYPASLMKENVKGEAVVAIRIGRNGAVYDPVVRSATEPAFGDAALAAVRLWRFLPKVRDSAPVETEAVVPISFDLPGPAAKQESRTFPKNRTPQPLNA